MNKKLYLHIGQYKTGSTSIQNFLDSNRRLLLEAGILYPAALTRDCGHFVLDDRLRAEYRYGNHRAELEELLGELSFSAHETLILSCEAFSGDLDRFCVEQTTYVWNRISEIFGDYRIRPIVYLRRQDEAIESRIIEAVKGRMRYREIDVDKFLGRDSPLDYRFFLAKLAETFGDERLVLRLYSKDRLMGGDVVRDFAGVCGINVAGLVFDSQEYNRAPGGKYLEFVRHLNRYELSDDLRVGLRRLAWGVFDAQGGQEASRVLDYATRRKIMTYFFAANTELVRKHAGKDIEGYIAEFFGDSRTDEPNCTLNDSDVMDVFFSYIESQNPGAQGDGSP